CDAVLASGGTLHLMGLLSPGGVHSHESHLFAMLDLAARRGVPRVAVHAFLDGRDMPPRSAEPSLRALRERCAAAGNAHVASVSGRYYAMDRDKRWERVRLAWDAIVEARGPGRDAHTGPACPAATGRWTATSAGSGCAWPGTRASRPGAMRRMRWPRCRRRMRATRTTSS